MTRVSLTKKQLTTAEGMELLSLLVAITKDGEASLGEVQHLRDWLDAKASADLPAITWLREIVGAVLADGKVTPEERVEMLLAFERVLPPEERVVAKLNRKSADLAAGQAEVKPKKKATRWEDHPATDNQIGYMGFLGIAFDPKTITKGQATTLISERLNASISNRQMMVLRFWNKPELAKLGSRQVSEWIDEWYTKDTRHRAAWTLWKQESGDTGGQGDPERVPIGIGFEVMKRVPVEKQPEREPVQEKEAKAKAGVAAGCLAWVVVLAIAAWLLSKCSAIIRGE